MTTCDRCGASLETGLKFCTSCGTPVRPTAARCGTCGNALAPDDRFCQSCGAPAAAPIPAAAAPIPAAAAPIPAAAAAPAPAAAAAPAPAAAPASAVTMPTNRTGPPLLPVAPPPPPTAAPADVPAPPAPSTALSYAGFWRRVAAMLADGAVLWIVALALDRIDDGLIAIAWIGYWVGFWSVGATPGQRLLGLRVVTESGRPPSLAGSVIRLVGLIVSCLALAIGVVWVAFDQRKQGWHDRMAGTFVVRG